MKKLFAYIFLWVVPWTLSADFLKTEDVKRITDEFFSYHVEVRSFSPQVVKRSFRIYIEQFDPEKIYLLKEEAFLFLEIDQRKTNKIIESYNKGDFSYYAQLNEVIHASLLRAKRWRAEFETKVIKGEISLDQKIENDSHNGYASDESTLKKRIWENKRVKIAKVKGSSSVSIEKVFKFSNRKEAHFENEYLLIDEKGRSLDPALQEHRFCTHLLKAFAQSLDAHSAFYTKEEALEMRASLQKQFEGVGVVLRDGVEGIVIADLLENSPAKRSGQIKVGDHLVEVNGAQIKELIFEEVLEKMQGNEKNKTLVLGLKRGEELFHVTLLREKIVMNSDRLTYTVEPFGEGVIAKMMLPGFYENGELFSSETDLKAALRELRKEKKLLGIVLDMRENGGGFLGQAVKVAGLFITSGVIVISKYADGEVRYYRDVDGRVFYDGPLVILTSKASASAAEIVAQALQDYGVGLVVGDPRTYGKGSMQYQTITEENAAAYFKITVGRFYTVSGKSTQIDGVESDILIPTLFTPYAIGERFLEFPLKNDRLEAVYQDPLHDVDQVHKGWFHNHYLPVLQKQEVKWRSMLPQLKSNSTYRLSKDPNFGVFLESCKKGAAKGLNWGQEDLQMTEAVNIVKDMLLLDPALKH